MSDEPHFTDDNAPQPPQPPPGEGDIPASVTFMEIMRRAAAKAESERPPRPAPPVSVTKDPRLATATQTQVKVATAPVDPKRQYDSAMEEQRIQRVKKRQSRRRRQTVGVMGGIFRSVLVIVIAAALMATRLIATRLIATCLIER